jgi:hypothetical protein
VAADGADTPKESKETDKAKTPTKEKKKGGAENGASIIKLKAPSATTTHESKSAALNEGAGGEAAQKVPPIKLTLKLGPPPVAAPVTEKPKGTQVTTKLTLSIRRPSVDQSKGEEVDIVGPLASEVKLPKKRGRKKGSKSSKSVESVGNEDAAGKAEKKPRKTIQSAPVSLASSTDSLRFSKSQSLSNVSIPVVQKPVFSEEDRQIRQVITDLLQQKIAQLHAHRGLWNVPPPSADALIHSLWPFYEELGLTEVSQSTIFKQAGLDRRLQGEAQAAQFEALRSQFSNMLLADKTVLILIVLFILIFCRSKNAMSLFCWSIGCVWRRKSSSTPR